MIIIILNQVTMFLLNVEKSLKYFFRKLRKEFLKIVIHYSSFINLIFEYIFRLRFNLLITKS